MLKKWGELKKMMKNQRNKGGGRGKKKWLKKEKKKMNIFLNFKKMKKWKNEKNEKNEKMKKNDEKKKQKWWNLDSHAKSSTISMIVFRNVSLSIGKSTYRFGVSPFFSEEKWQFSFDVKQEHTFYWRKLTKKIAKVSPSNNNYSFRAI